MTTHLATGQTSSSRRYGLPPVRTIGAPRLLAGVEASPTGVDHGHHRWLHGDRRPIGRAALQKQLDASRLLGRGGAAFPVARKLAALPHRGGVAVVVNGSESEPASFKDRALLTLVPHLVIDGVLAVAEAISAWRIQVDIHDSAAAATFRRAVQARDDADRIKVVASAGGFVAGEATAVVSRLDGGAGVPDGLRTLPTTRGIGSVPTFLCNVETFAQIGILVQHGVEAFATSGVVEEPGTSLYSVTGAVPLPCLVEAPTGVSLYAVLDAAGGVDPVAVLVGGYHGSWLSPVVSAPTEQVILSRPGMRRVGAGLGTGSISVLPDDTCPLGEAARVAQWLAGQSIGQCGPCLFGLPALAEDLDRLVRGDHSRWSDLTRHLEVLPGRGACAHPDGTARFVASAIRAFRPDVEAHQAYGSCGRPVLRVLPLPDEPVPSARRRRRKT